MINLSIPLLFLALPLFSDGDVSPDLRLAVDNIIFTLKKMGAMDSLSATKKKALREELELSIVLEDRNHMKHIINEWRTPKSREAIIKHLSKCRICRVAKDIIMDLESTSVENVPLDSNLTSMRNSYVKDLYDEHGYMKNLSSAEAKKILKFIMKPRGLYSLVSDCRLNDLDCRPGKDLNALRASNDSIENDVSALYSVVGNDKEKIIHIKRSLRIDEDNPAWHHNLGVHYYQNGKMSLALTHWARSIALKSDYAPAARNLAIFYRENPGVSKNQACKLADIALKGESSPKFRVILENFISENCR